MTLTISQCLGAFSAGLTEDALPVDVIDKAKACLLHLFGCGVEGASTPVAGVARKTVESLEPGPCLLWATPHRVSSVGAAFANGAACHSRFHEDSYKMVNQLGPAIVPAAVALGEERDISGQELLLAIVAGYEVAAAVIDGYNNASNAHGFRSSAIYGIVGATAAASRVLGLSEEQTAHSLGFAATFASGTLEAVLSQTQEVVLQVAHAGRDAVLAARLAEAGYAAAPTAFEGPAGFYHSLVGVRDGLDQVGARLGQRWEILDVPLKTYPCSMFDQAIIRLVLKLSEDNRLQPDDVQGIAIYLHPLDAGFPGFPRYPAPGGNTTGHEHFAAAALVAGTFPVPKEQEAALAPEIERVKSRTMVRALEQVPQGDCWVSLRCRKDGATYVDKIQQASVFKVGLMQDLHVAREMLLGGPLPYDQVRSVIQGIVNLEQVKSVRELTALLGT